MDEIKKEKILITVKTYPTLSAKYGETVCTAGLREDGTWVRIYPVPFRRLDEKQRYKKFNWIECVLQRNSKKDFRPESYRPVDPDNECQFEPTGFVDTKNNWRQRRNLVLRKAVVYTNMEELIKDAKNENKLTSLAVFKPKQLLGFETEKTDPEWSEEKLKKMREYNGGQLDLFSDEEWRKVFKLVKKSSIQIFLSIQRLSEPRETPGNYRLGNRSSLLESHQIQQHRNNSQKNKTKILH